MSSTLNAMPVVAAVIIFPDDMVLVQQRTKSNHADCDCPDKLLGYWGFAGGKIMCGEQPEQALVREVQEELGIAVKPVSPIYQRVNTYASGTDYLVTYYCCICSGQKPVRGDVAYIRRPSDLQAMRVLPGTVEAAQKTIIWLKLIVAAKKL